MVWCKSKTRGSLIREPDSRKLANNGLWTCDSSLRGVCWVVQAFTAILWLNVMVSVDWPMSCQTRCNLLVLLPPPGTEPGSNSGQKRSLTDPDRKSSQHERLLKHILQMFSDNNTVVVFSQWNYPETIKHPWLIFPVCNKSETHSW